MVEQIKSLREKILEVEDSPYEEVFIKEWDTKVKVRTMSGMERYEFESSLEDKKNIMVKMLVVTLCDPETGERLFTDADIEAVNKKNSKVLIRLFNVAKRLNALEAKEVEELTKN